ncbi:Cysteine-rich secretory protein family protein [Leptolyngbya sp. O-77]|nr:Cysteine-rich secretory protein family protein [Leptolyngbya sp. O-77]
MPKVYSFFTNIWCRLFLILPIFLVSQSLSRQTESPQLSNRFNGLTIGKRANAQSQDDWAQIEQDIIAEHNKVRQDPASYIPLLEARLASMDAAGNILNGYGPNSILTTHEGQAAVREAIAFLQNQASLPPISLSSSAAQAAKAHALDQAGGAFGHIGSDGSTWQQRLERQGTRFTQSGENIAYGSPTAQEVVLDLIVDDGVSNRGHRTNIFSPRWTHAGAGCGFHRRYQIVCVINYTASSSRLKVVNNSNVNLQSVEIGGVNILNSVLHPGQTQEIALNESQCEANSVRIQLGGGFNPLVWSDVTLCGATVTFNANNSIGLSYDD